MTDQADDEIDRVNPVSGIDRIKSICIAIGLCAIAGMVSILDPFLPFVEFTTIAEEGGLVATFRQTTFQDMLLYMGVVLVQLSLYYDVGARPEDE